MTHIVLGSSDGPVNALMMTIIMTTKFKRGLGLAQPCRFCFGGARQPGRLVQGNIHWRIALSTSWVSLMGVTSVATTALNLTGFKC